MWVFLRQEILEKTHSMTKSFQRLFSRKSSIDLTEISTLTSMTGSGSGNTTSGAYRNNGGPRSSLSQTSPSPASAASSNSKHYNTITSHHVTLSNADSEHLAQLYSQFSKFTYHDQYTIVQKTIASLIDIYKSLDSKNYLPRLQYIQFLFELMESSVNVFNLMLFAIRLLHVGPLIDKYLRAKFVPNDSSTRIVYFEYLSHFYLNVVGVLRMHSASLILWKDLASQVFKRYQFLNKLFFTVLLRIGDL